MQIINLTELRRPVNATFSEVGAAADKLRRRSKRDRG